MYRVCGHKLSVWSRLVDEVAYCVELLYDVSSPESEDLSVNWILEWVACIVSCPRRPPRTSNVDLVRNLMKVLLAQKRIKEGMMELRYDVLSSIIPQLIDPLLEDEELEERDKQFINQGEFYRHFKLVIDSISGRRLLFVTRNGRFGSPALSVKPGDAVH